MNARSTEGSFEEATTRLLGGIARPPVAGTAARIAVVAGPDSGLDVQLDVSHRTAYVGHAKSCDIVLSDRTVSRRHVSLARDDRGLLVTDLGSRNGSFVSNVRVTGAYLRAGDTIRLGETELRFVEEGAPTVIDAWDEARFGRVVAASASMRRIFTELSRVASSPSSILLEGETGTGKETLAEAVHSLGSRAEASFIVVDCDTSAPADFERTLLGDSGADGGLLAAATGGTLYLDEVSRIPLPTQVKLVRALERAGANVRVIAGTERDLERCVYDRTFREDLLALVSGARFVVPPLRNRREDVALLTRYFWLMFGGRDNALPAELLERFQAHTWPGNVRELKLAVARTMAEGNVALEATPSASAPAAAGADFIDAIVRKAIPLATAREEVVLEFEERYVRHMLSLHGGHVGHASAAAGIGRRRFQKLRTGR